MANRELKRIAVGVLMKFVVADSLALEPVDAHEWQDDGGDEGNHAEHLKQERCARGRRGEPEREPEDQSDGCGDPETAFGAKTSHEVGEARGNENAPDTHE